MRAVQIHEYGHSDRMVLETVPEPKPGKGQVLVKIHDAGVNPVDWKIREGYMKDVRPTPFPYTLGQDFSGEVVEAGEGVTGFKRGDRVFGFAQGSYAEYALASSDGVAHLPHGIGFDAAAAVPTAGLTAWQLVTDEAKVSAGQTVLIHGAAGGVGSFAVQFCNRAGARVIASTARDDFPYLQELGVDQLIDYKTERFEDKARDVDAVIDLVGGETLNRSYAVPRKGGLVITTVGPVDEERAQRHEVRASQFVMRRDARELTEIGRLVKDGLVRPRLGKVMALSEARDAEDLSQLGHPHGKVVLHVA